MMMLPEKQNSKNSNLPLGSALVLGGGIGGMQAALDLAEAGIKVYLLDNAAAIGGMMSQLDKTFPTNDCAMCIMSPKLVDVGRHLNIEIITTAGIAGISGQSGNYAVEILKQPRYVDLAKCTGCGDCAEVCPVSRPDQFNGGLSERKAIYKLYPQAIPNAFAIEKAGTSPCRDGCPIDQRAQGYLALVKEGRFADAYRTIKEENPFPSICGRVCNHACETACSLNEAALEPVNIMAVKRFVADWAGAHPEQTAVAALPRPQVSGKKVAVIGSGPAGLACALDLVRNGHQATVLEAQPVPGGMMRLGVPQYRLPYDLVQAEIDAVLAEGVELKLNCRVDEVSALLTQGFDAVFIATGAHRGVTLPIPGADLAQVYSATDFLRALALREIATNNSSIISAIALGEIHNKRVLVLGGGNVAVDSAMSAVRLGASWVAMACLESRQKMPSHDWEIRDAEAEGIEILPSRTFKEILSRAGRVTGMRACKVEFRGFINGKPDFTELDEGDETISADLIIFAIGQLPDLSLAPEDSAITDGRFFIVDEDSLATGIPGIFAGGDAVTGTSFIVDAIAAGHRAALSIDSYLAEQTGGREKTIAPEEQEQKQDQKIAQLSREEVLARASASGSIHLKRTQTRARNADERKRDFLEVYQGLTEEEAKREASRCLSCGICSECNQCVYACEAGAIDHRMREATQILHVGALILSPGVETMPGAIRREFGYDRYPNVITSLEFERMLSASGPFMGVVKRPGDGKHPRKVAWIQCVGSRDLSCEQDYCSAVCCMYATKEAVIAKEHDHTIEPTIFYMDMRAFGKGFDSYIQRAETEQGIRYIRSMVSAVREIPGSGSLRLSYATFDNSGKPQSQEEEYDLVVLSVGLKPATASMAMARRLGLDLNNYGFAESPPNQPTASNKPGIFVAGAFGEPKDIPETVIEASCAAALVSAALAPARGTLTREPVFPPQRDISEEEPRVGVFVCHCGINIGGVVDVPAVVDFALDLPGVVYAERNLYTCSQDTQEKITSIVAEQGLNRVVVASCTPRTHEPLFQDTIRQAGLNPHLFEMTNIREQDSWVHRKVPQIATQKAKQLIAMAVAKAQKLKPLKQGKLKVDQQALVIGGGLAGMTAALSISHQGFKVLLVEKSRDLGGHLRHIRTGLGGTDPQQLLENLKNSISRDPHITLFTDSQLSAVDGYVGQFKSVVTPSTGESFEIGHGVIIVATGAQEITPVEFGYGASASILTQRELEEKKEQLFPDKGKQAPKSVVMIQCAGSRDNEHPYCSRVCCTQALKNALWIKKNSPDSQIAVLYRDIRTYGFRERLYRQAREAGVVFLRYEEQEKPQVSTANGKLQVALRLMPQPETIELNPDLVVLSTGIAAEGGNQQISKLLKLPLTKEGFFLEAHVKLRPVDFAADGVFLCGLAHSPRSMDESIAQAQAAAVRAVRLLSKKELTATPIIAEVNALRCAACGLCVEVCPFGARLVEDGAKTAQVIEVLCQGCGSCVATCPNKATQQRGFEGKQVYAMIDEAVKEY